MFCNVAFVCRMLVLVALAAEIAQFAHAAPTASSGWDTVTQAAEASMTQPSQLSVSREATDSTSSMGGYGSSTASTSSMGGYGSSTAPITSSQVQSAATLASQHDVQDQPGDTTVAASEATAASTYDLCRSLYPELVPKVVAPTNVTSIGAHGGPSSSSSSSSSPSSNSGSKNNTSGSSTNSTVKPAASNTTQVLPCNNNTQDYVDMCVYCGAYNKTDICTKFRPAPGQCDSVKAACLGKYTAKTPRYLSGKRRRQSSTNGAAQQNTGSSTTNAASAAQQNTGSSTTTNGAAQQSTGSSTTNAVSAASSNSSSNTGSSGSTSNTPSSAANTNASTATAQSQEPLVNEMLCQQVLNAPRV